MYLGGVDLPAALIDAHATGRLVIFVGAGASMGYPSLLPSFKGLVKQIRDTSNLASVFTDRDLDESPLDEILGRIEGDHGVDVHQRVFEIVAKDGSRPSPLHEAIAHLMSVSTVRVITTNYDLHLSNSLQDCSVAEYLAPALPLGNDFTGIIYIHGRIDQEHRHLIATDEDFGRAYLYEAWATRFLARVFGEYPVLFIGYSHNDTIMKYLARGLGGRSEKRYVLTSDKDEAFWRRLGITPIQCSHADQPALLNDWAVRSAEGLLGTRDRVKQLVAEQYPSRVPEVASFLEEIVGSKDKVRFFREFARGKAWLQWVDSRPEFATLFHPSPSVDVEVTRELSLWFAENYVTEEDDSDIAFEIVVNAGGCLGDELLYAVSRRLSDQPAPLSERMRRWLLVVANGRENRFKATFLSMMLDANALRDDPDTALFLLDYLAEPRILPSGTFSQLFGGSFEPAMREGDVSLRDIWGRAFQPHVDRFATQLIDIAERHLRRSDMQLAVASEADRERPSTWRPRIVADDHNLGSPLGFLVDVARECLENMLATGAPEADIRLQAWQASDVVLLRRLALHGWTIRADKTAAEKIAWLLTSGWLNDHRLRVEANGLVLDTCASAGEDAIAALVEDIRLHWEDDKYAPRRAYNLLKSIDQITRP